MTAFEFIRNLAIGTFLTLLNLVILLWALRPTLPYLKRQLDEYTRKSGVRDFLVPMAIVVSLLFFGHLLQFATWAAVFVAIGQFDSYTEAFYFSAVNFTSLGYGDIVMDPQWRLLGPLQAANGVLMFGLSAGLLVSLMSVFIRAAENTNPPNPVD